MDQERFPGASRTVVEELEKLDNMYASQVTELPSTAAMNEFLANLAGVRPPRIPMDGVRPAEDGKRIVTTQVDPTFSSTIKRNYY